MEKQYTPQEIEFSQYIFDMYNNSTKEVLRLNGLVEDARKSLSFSLRGERTNLISNIHYLSEMANNYRAIKDTIETKFKEVLDNHPLKNPEETKSEEPKPQVHEQ